MLRPRLVGFNKPKIVNFNPADKTNITLSFDDLSAETTGVGSVRSLLACTPGKKWYVELLIDLLGGNPGIMVGMGKGSSTSAAAPGGSGTGSVAARSDGAVLSNGVVTNGVISGGFGAGAVIGIQIDGTTVSGSVNTYATKFNKNGGAFSSAFASYSGGDPVFVRVGSTATLGKCTVLPTPAFAIPAGFTYWGT